MATKLINGCSYSDIWVNPENWQTVKGKKAVEAEWYVQCKFFDPRFKAKYPYGYPFRKRLNNIHDLQERKEKVRILLHEIPYLFEELHYNPVPAIKGYMAAPNFGNFEKVMEQLKTKHYSLESCFNGTFRKCPAFDVAHCMAAHQSPEITNEVNKVGKEKREREVLKNLRIKGLPDYEYVY